jgi:hypothetical protein
MTTRSSARVIVSTSLASAWRCGCRRLLTDVRTGLLDVLGGRLHYQDFWRSLRSVHAEAVFNCKEPIPGTVECALS